MKKKILAVMLIATMTISCVACGSNNSSNTETNESSSVESTESSKKETTTDKSDKTESKSDTETKKDDSKADDKTSESTTEDKSDDKKSDSADNSASKPAEDKKSDSNSGNTGSNNSANKPSNGNSNKSDSSTSKPSQSTEKPADSTPAHQHTWVDHTATKTVTEYVHHDAVYQDVTTPAVTGMRVKCRGCGKYFSSLDELNVHATLVALGKEPGNTSNGGGCGSYTEAEEVVITPAKTEHKLVKEAYDEPVQKTETYVDYQYCSGCGQHK